MGIFFVLLGSLLSFAGDFKPQVLSSYMVSAPSAEMLKSLSSLFEIENHRGTDFEVVVPAEQSNLLLALAPHARLVEADMAAATRAKLASYRANRIFTMDTNQYHDFNSVQSWMNSIVTAMPKNAQVIEYGKSRAGRPLLALTLTEDITRVTGRPQLMITAATHGDELITTEVLLAFVDQIVAGYNKDERFTAMINKHDLYFIPVVNPDGYTSTERYDYNQDPNRSYPYPGHENVTPSASIAGIINFFNGHKIAGSIDFHAYGQMIMYPWAYTHSPIDSAIAQKFNQLTGGMAAQNHYAYGPISDVIYLAPGSSADYYFWKKGTTGIAIEMGDNKVPDPSEIPSYVSALAESTWKFIESF